MHQVRVINDLSVQNQSSYSLFKVKRGGYSVI